MKIKIFLDENYIKRVEIAIKNSSEINLKNFHNLGCVYQFINEQLEDYFSNKCEKFIDEIEVFFFKIIKDYVNIAFKGYQNLINCIINIFNEK